MRIIGIDPGSTIIGYGIVEYTNSKFTCIDYGVITNAGRDKSSEYLSTEKALSSIMKKYHPDVAAIERLFFFNNQKTALPVSEMRGVLILSLARAGLPIFEFTPLEIKQGVTGYGRADKTQIEKMVRIILGIKKTIRPDDASDALAIAICGANNYTPLKVTGNNK
jgi:crossover junction endodeoxyribonuclease RuvC